MFKYGKKAGYMGIALLVLAVLPLVVAAFVIPTLVPRWQRSLMPPAR